MPQKKEVMEFKIQILINGNWIDTLWAKNMTNYQSVKLQVDHLRKMDKECKYRIVGREKLPWCEIKEDEVKYE